LANHRSDPYAIDLEDQQAAVAPTNFACKKLRFVLIAHSCGACSRRAVETTVVDKHDYVDRQPPGRSG